MTSDREQSLPPIKLRDPGFSAFLAWLIPGAGHIYQRRTAKGILFFVCIMGTFFFGLFVGTHRVVYASWDPQDRRLPYLCQVGVGLPPLIALVQAQRVSARKEPLFGGFMAPPANTDQADAWHKKYARYYELGTVYTMIAGLLNVLAIYDAYGGPVRPAPDEKTSAKGRKEDEDESDEKSSKPEEPEGDAPPKDANSSGAADAETSKAEPPRNK